MQETLKLTVNGMHCGGCVTRVTAALNSVPGVKVNSVEVGLAQVAFDSVQATAPQILAAIERIGFSATVQQ